MPKKVSCGVILPCSLIITVHICERLVTLILQFFYLQYKGISLLWHFGFHVRNKLA